VSDRELLEAFSLRGEEAAFAALLRRHGPMVLGVCRRILGHEQDAEDAFQATFLLFARKASSIRKRESVASWLYAVAGHTAGRALRSAARRRAAESRVEVGHQPGPDFQVAARELQAVLDEELAALPEKHRAALLLCYFEGRTVEEAARELGCPRGTVASRLAGGRELLRKRLARRGLALSAGALTTLLLSGTDLAALPPALVTITLRAGFELARGKAAVVTSAAVARLVTGGLKGMSLTNLKILAVLLLAGLAAGGAALAHQALAPTPPPPEQQDGPEVAAGTPRPKAPEGPQARADRQGDPLPAGTLARMGTARLRHGSSVFFVAFLPDGKQVLSAGEDGLARLWDVATGKEVRRFGTPYPVPPLSLAVALSPDGKALATTCDGDDGVRLWDTATGRQTGQVKGLAFSVAFPTDRLGGEGRAAWSRALKTAFSLAFSPDGKTLAAGGPTGQVVLWDLARGKEARRFNDPPRQRRNVPNRKDKDYDLATADKILSLIRRPNGPAGGGQGIWNERDKPHLAFSADGKTLLTTNLEYRGPNLTVAVKLWDVATGKELRRVETGDKAIAVSAALSPDGKAVAWTDQDAAGGGTVHLMEAATGKERHRLAAGGAAYVVGPAARKDPRRFPGVGTKFAFAPDGRTLVTRAVGGQVIVWDVATGKELRRLGKPLPPPTWSGGISILSPPGLAVSPDGKTLAVAGDGNQVTLLDLATGREVHPRGGHQAAVTAVRYAADGKALTSLGGDGSVRSWEAATGKETGRARVPSGTLTSALSPDGRTLASAGIDGKVGLTEAATGKERGTIQVSIRGALRLALSPDGKTLAVGGYASPTVRLYDVATGKETRVLKPQGEKDLEPAGFMVIPFRIAPPPVFSADGKLLAAPGRSALHIWDAVAGRDLRRLALPKDRAVGGAVFAPDGRSVALDMQDGTVALWEVATGKERRLYESGPATVPSRPLGGPPGSAAPLAPADPALLAFSPDGRVLAHGRGREVAVWDVGSGKELGRLKGHGGAFAPAGKALATAGADTTALVWDVAALTHGAPQGRALTAEDRGAAWAALAGHDAAQAFDAVVALAAAPRQAVPFLGERLKPAAPAEARRVEGLIADLDSDEFAVRQKAADELKKLGRLAVPALKKALAGPRRKPAAGSRPCSKRRPTPTRPGRACGCCGRSRRWSAWARPRRGSCSRASPGGRRGRWPPRRRGRRWNDWDGSTHRLL
jgi:RNA polymerase sigma factor (sigma-70 family)